MALDPLYVTSVSLDEIFLDKDTGEPLANGYIEFYQDDNRAIAKPVYEITGAPPNYTYAALPNPVILGANGAPVNNTGEPVSIYYYPYDPTGNLQLYFVQVYNSANVLQFSRQAWPNITTGIEDVVIVTSANQAIAGGITYICDNGVVQIDFALPAVMVEGQFFTIIGKSSGGWTISQNAGQTIHMGNQSTTTGVGGSLSSTNRYDCITMRCVESNTDFNAYSAQGNLAVV